MAQAQEPIQYQGINRVALVSRDMAETVDFWTNVMDFKLVKTLNLPGGRQHFFFDSGNGGTISFIYFPDAPKAAPGVSSVHVDKTLRGNRTAVGSMNHIAIDIPLERFQEYYDKLKARSVSLTHTYHNDDPDPPGTMEKRPSTWVQSLYFWDPNGVRMELAAYTRTFGPADRALAAKDSAGKPVIKTLEAAK
jgi:catechol 2,3-dioxygenase-like lactoylglutathione lyase family enzyme